MASQSPELFADGFLFGEGMRWYGDRLWMSDMLGRKVSTLVDDVQVAGWYPMRITTRHLAAGTYVVRMEAADFRSVKTIVVVR